MREKTETQQVLCKHCQEEIVVWTERIGLLYPPEVSQRMVRQGGQHVLLGLENEPCCLECFLELVLKQTPMLGSCRFGAGHANRKVDLEQLRY